MCFKSTLLDKTFNFTIQVSQRPEGAPGNREGWRWIRGDDSDTYVLGTWVLGTWVPGYLGPWYLGPPIAHLVQAINLDHELPNHPSTDVPESVSKRLSFRDKVTIIIIIIIVIFIIIVSSW